MATHPTTPPRPAASSREPSAAAPAPLSSSAASAVTGAAYTKMGIHALSRLPISR
jgi:hypothetical protein